MLRLVTRVLDVLSSCGWDFRVVMVLSFLSDGIGEFDVAKCEG